MNAPWDSPRMALALAADFWEHEGQYVARCHRDPLPDDGCGGKNLKCVDGEESRRLAAEVLNDAAGFVSGDRRATHGDATTNMLYAAGLLERYLGVSISARDVAFIYVLLKIARTMVGDGKERDHYLDAAAYCALAYEVEVNSEGTD